MIQQVENEKQTDGPSRHLPHLGFDLPGSGAATTLPRHCQAPDCFDPSLLTGSAVTLQEVVMTDCKELLAHLCNHLSACHVDVDICLKKGQKSL